MMRVLSWLWIVSLADAQPAGNASPQKLQLAIVNRTQLQAEARAAFDTEMAREKAGDCRSAGSTYDINQCLSKETAGTKANYDAFVSKLRTLVGLGRIDTPQPSGPTGRPLTRTELLNEFDAAAAAWDQYRESQCQAAFDQYKGGTIAPSQAGSCELLLRRSRMRDLHGIYGFLLVN
jgi:uncharacterized protein YecT (DUF1311 family)